MSAIPQRRVYKGNSQNMGQKIDIKECLKLLYNDEFPPSLWDVFKEELKLKPQVGDHIQYELHKYCQRDISKIDANVVIKLAEMCYSPNCVACFTNIERFVGCVYYISSFLLKKEKYEAALKAANSLLLKKKEIVKCSKEKSDVRTYLYNLHSSFIASAVTLTSRVQNELDTNCINSHKLAVESLKFFTFTNSEQREAGRKMLKNSTLYLQSLKVYNKKYVLEFYNTLNDTCKILLPNMGSYDYCRYYLHKMIYLDKLDLEEVFLVLEKTVCFVTIILDCPTQVQNVLYKILVFFWKNCDEEAWISEEDFAALNVFTKGSNYKNELYFLLVSNIFTYGIQFLWRKYEQNWHEKFSTSGLQKILGTVLSYHESYIKKVISYCTRGEDPFATCFAYLNSRNLQKIQYTVRLCLKNKIPSSLVLVQISRRAYRLSMECFEDMKSRTCCREHADYLWKSAVIHHTNTVEDVCRHQPSVEVWFYLRDCCEEVLREVVQSDNSIPFDFNRIKILFQRWHTAHMKLGNYREALFVCMIYCLFYPNEEKDFMSMWIQTKSETSNDVVEEVITSEIFSTYEENFKEFCKNYDSSNVPFKSILIMELKAYSAFCSPKTFQQTNVPFNLATRIWKQLEKYDLDVWEKSLALSFLISFCSSTETETVPHYLDEKCRELIQDLMDGKHQGKMQCRSLLHAANLTFSLFLFNVKRTERTEGKMDTTNMVLDYLKKAEMDKIKFGEDVDLNLTCDVIPSSSHLTVDLETNYLNELNKIVDLWSSAFGKAFEESLSAFEFDLWLRNVKQVAHLYELTGEYQRAFSTWILFYRIGKLCKNSEAILSGLTHLIENCMDVDESGMKQEADLIKEKLSTEARDKNIIAEYLLAVASNYLKNKKSEKCLEYLSATKEILEGLRTTVKTYTLNAKFWCLVSQFLAVYKEYKTAFEFSLDIDLRVIAFKAFSYANGGGKSDLIKSASQSECMELVLTMLEVNLWAYNLHGVYLQSDFMRFFLDDLYQIVQKLFLPTRTAEMLARLAEVDLICEKVSDCHEKVTKLKSILTNTTVISSEGTKFDKSASPYLSVPQKDETKVPVQRLISPARFLDEQPQSKEFDTSPIRCYLADTKAIAIREHKKNCKCRLCQNLLIQALTMNAFWLEAEIYSLSKNSKHAAEYYSRACTVLNSLQFVRAEQNKMLHLQLASCMRSVPGELDFKRNFIQYHCVRFLIKYAYFDLTNSKTVTENTRKTIARIGKMMEQFSYEEKLLEWAFAELKLTCVHVHNEGDTKPPNKSTPVLLEKTTITKTPVVRAPVGSITAVRKSTEKDKNSVHVNAVKGKVGAGNNGSSSSDRMNTAFIEEEETIKTYKKIIQPKKLIFSSQKTESNNKTVIKKALLPKENCLKSRKLDFDVTEDTPEEKDKKEAEKAMSAPRRGTRKCPPRSVLAERDNRQPVTIYKDSKDEEKPKTTSAVKSQRKTRKNNAAAN